MFESLKNLFRFTKNQQPLTNEEIVDKNYFPLGTIAPDNKIPKGRMTRTKSVYTPKDQMILTSEDDLSLGDKSPSGDKEAFDAFWYWINERHSIYLNRKAGEPKPWTKDPILQDYRFCNVFRELDTVTMDFKKLFAPYADHKNLWFMYCMARAINWPETVEEIMKKTDFPEVWIPEQVYKVMVDRRASGAKVYTGAYMLGCPGEADKPNYTCQTMLNPIWKAHRAEQQADGWEFPSTIQAMTEWLEGFKGWGGFLGYEVATDLRHTRYLNHSPDIMTWANPGPGAKRGLNRIFNRPLEGSRKKKEWLDEMRWLLKISHQYLESYVPALEMRDIEHSLCETDKMLRVRHGEGKPRAKYNGRR